MCVTVALILASKGLIPCLEGIPYPNGVNRQGHSLDWFKNKQKKGLWLTGIIFWSGPAGDLLSLVCYYPLFAWLKDIPRRDKNQEKRVRATPLIGLKTNKGVARGPYPAGSGP